ncbi:MAG TPA: bile acid:sodium symporter, partial [Gemmataceae bacterium]|nr:bile acid:sodium symporter [Gemmataceae bacterium]
MDTQQLVSLINVTALVVIMFSMGLQVTIADVVASARAAGRVTLGLLANYVLVPGVTLLLLRLFDPDPFVAVGFLILAVCPGAPVSPLATKLAKGNVPWSIGMMVILASLSALLSPALLSVLLSWLLTDSDLTIDYLAIVRTLLVAQLLPLAAGLAIHHWAPKFTGKVAKPINLVANVMLLVL